MGNFVCTVFERDCKMLLVDPFSEVRQTILKELLIESVSIPFKESKDKLFLAGTWRLYYVAETSVGRHDVVSTLMRQVLPNSKPISVGRPGVS